MWKQYKDTPYEVNEYGRVRHKKRPAYLLGTYIDHGYERLGNEYVHRMVATCFIDNPDSLPQVNHIDGDKANNRVNNLEWCSASYNVQHAYNTGLHNPMLGTPVKQYDLQGNLIAEYPSVRQAAKAIGKPKGTANIFAVMQGKYRQAYGYIWT